jgi:YD repeat-containing protein
MLAPVVSTTTTIPPPVSLTSVQSVSRTATFSGGNLATLTEQTTLNGNTWTRLFNASSNTWTTTSPKGRQTTMTIDAAERPTQLAVLGATPPLNPISFAYDTDGRIKTMTQGTRTWTMGYDANGYLQSLTDPLMNPPTSYLNDGIGRPTKTTLADGRLLLTGYDGDSDLTSVTLPDGGPGNGLHQMNYTPVDLLHTYTPPSLSSSSPTTT